MKKKATLFIFLILSLLLILNRNYAIASEKISLTDSEENFINEHPEIHIGVDPSFLPYEFIDKDGEYKGIAADYIKLICERTGLNMIVEKNLSWPDAYKKASEGELDVLPCISRTEERAKIFLYSDSYESFQRAIFIKKSNANINGFDDLINKRVAAQTNSSHHSYLKTFDNIELSLYSSVTNALAAVASGKEIAFVGNLATSNYLIKLSGISNLKSIEMEMATDNGLYFAVRQDWPELVSILNKGLASITHEERIQIDNKWNGEDSSVINQKILRIIIIISGIALLVFALSSFWIIKLKKEITLRKKTEADLKSLKNEADLSNEFKSLFLARMSHEIRTPLNAITGMTYLLAKTEVNPSQKMYLDKIIQAAKNMLGIINDILDFSKIEAGKIELEKAAFNLDLVLEQVVTIISYRVEEQGIEFSINKGSDVPTNFIGDSLRIQQILINIINNAIKFTKQGSVYVSISLLQKVEDMCTIEFKVKDTGIGMSEEQLNQIFKPFDQGDSSISRKFGGTGLGLTISKNLIEMMDGDIHVNSAENVGSTFTFHLTLKVDYTQEHKENTFKSSVDFGQLRVLVIEKSYFYCNMLQEYLGAFHITPEFINSGEEGMDRIETAYRKEKRPYDLLIMDYNTPSEDGIEFYSKVSKRITQMPKCILMIPISREYLFENLESTGIDAGIIKPFLPSTLFNSILEIMKEKVLTVQTDSAATMEPTTQVTENSAHILVVEDNKTNQLIAETILNQAGYRITLTDDGKEGYEYFAAHNENVDLILMDLHMPVLNGFESSQLIRKIDKNIPIVAMTADAITGIEDKCKSYGINYYISKPFNPDEFVETITKVLATSNSQKLSQLKNNLEILKEDIQNHIREIDTEDGLRRIGGKTEIYQQILKQFYEENKDVSQQIRKTIESQDLKATIQIVHKLKSSSGNIGAKYLYQIASDLNSALKTEDHPQIDKNLPLLLDHLDKVLTEITFI